MSRVWLLLCVLALAARASQAQVPAIVWPFTGQGSWPPELGRAVITIDIHLDRFISVQETEQSWRGLHRFHLSWQDPRALDAVRDGTTAWYNANNASATSTVRSAFGGCVLPCDASINFESGCCDQLWLPQIDLPNLLNFDYQTNPPRWRIWVEPVSLPNGDTTGLVHWTVRLDGTWFSPYDFRAWPLEHQHLLIEVQPSMAIADRVSLVMGSTRALTNTPHTKGVDLAGWRINTVTPRLYDTSACYQLSNTTSWAFRFDSSTGEAIPQAITARSFVTYLTDNTTVTSIPASACDSLGNVEGRNQYGPYVLVIDTQILRDQAFYVLVYIVPLVIVDLLVFVVYALDRTNIEARMGVVITLVLALSALQFTYTFPPANYLNIVQQLSLTSFVLFGLVATCCIITSSIARIHERSKRYEAQLVAAGLKSLKAFGTMQAANLAADASKTSIGYDSQVSLDLDGGAFADPKANANAEVAAARPSGLFFGASGRDEWRDRVAVNIPPFTHAGAGEDRPSGTPQLPPITEDASDRHPYPYPQQGGARAVAEGTLWHSATPFLNKTRQQEQQQGGSGGGSSSGTGAEAPGTGVCGPPMAEEWADAPPANRPTPSRFQKGRHSVKRFINHVQATSRNVTNKISADEAYAQLVARRVDIICSVVLLLGYIIVLATIIPIGSSVGDHKLMLAGTIAPGNM